ncbi:MAG: hypothetical protein OHK0046_35970 [Anaerolineae bacterium]
MIGLGTAVVIAGILALTLVLVPENTSPAYDTATTFMNAAGAGDDATAFALLSPEMQTYVTENCPEGSVSACIDDYTPAEWGDLLSAVYRRSVPEGSTRWHVQLVATYEEGQGFAGVCIYHRMDEIAPDDWRVSAWSGFISCDDPGGRLNPLRAEDAPNRAP